MPEEIIESATELGSAYFPGISWADCIKHVRISQSALDEGKLVIKFHGVHRPETFRQFQTFKCCKGEESLVGQVMDGKYSCRALGCHGKQCGDKPALPVITMYDIRLPRQARLVQGYGGYIIGKSPNPFCIVRPIHPVRTSVWIAGPVEMLR